MLERGSKTFTVPVVWLNFGIFSALSKWYPVWRDCWQWCETWIYHNDPETSNKQLSDGIAFLFSPKNSENKNPLEKFSPRIFGIKTASSSLIILQRAKLSTRSVSHICWCNWRTFWRKNVTGNYPRGSCSCKKIPRLSWHLQPRKNFPRSPTLLSEKSNWKIAIFRPTRTSLLPRRPGWTENLLNFFLEWLAKVRAKE